MVDRIIPVQDMEIASDRVDYWLRIAHSTEALDRPAATEAICAIYEALGKKSPAVLFFSSPAMCILAWGALRTLWADRPQLRGQLEKQLWPGELRDQLENELDGVAEEIEGRIMEKLVKKRRGRVLHQLDDQWLWEHIARPLRRLHVLRDQLREQVDNKLKSRLWYPLRGQLLDQLRATPFPAAVPDRQILEQIDRQHLPGQITIDDLAEQVSNCCTASWGDVWQVVLDCASHMGVVLGSRRMAVAERWLKQRRSCHWWFPYEGIVLASERPCVLERDEAGRWHSAQGPALEYRDGYGLHAWHGVCVEPRLIVDPASITISEIEHEANAEIRRVMIERYGWTRYICDCGAQVVESMPMDHPIVGLRGARLLVKHLDGEPEPIVYLDMINSSVEADGTCKRYLERIDPKAYSGDAGRLCHAAMASRWHHRDDQGRLVRTFKRWQDYTPTAES